MAQTHIHRRSVRQVWHVLRGRRGTHGTGWGAWSGFVACDARGTAPLCVAGVALGDIHLRFMWQVWHLVTSTFVSRGRPGTDSVVLRGRRGTFCVAGVALMVLGGALGHFAWQAWHLVTSTLISRGRRGTNSHPPSFCVAGVARFEWQAWHSWYWVARLVRLCRL